MSDIVHLQLDKKFDDMMDFLVERMATKDDIAELRAELKQDIAVLDHKVIEIKQDIRELRDEVQSVKRDLARLEKMVIEDIDAYGKSIIELKQRVKILEQQVQALQSA